MDGSSTLPVCICSHSVCLSVCLSPLLVSPSTHAVLLVLYRRRSHSDGPFCSSCISLTFFFGGTPFSCAHILSCLCSRSLVRLELFSSFPDSFLLPLSPSFSECPLLHMQDIYCNTHFLYGIDIRVSLLFLPLTLLFPIYSSILQPHCLTLPRFRSQG